MNGGVSGTPRRYHDMWRLLDGKSGPEIAPMAVPR